jgi:ATP-dependent RNA helicase HelY
MPNQICYCLRAIEEKLPELMRHWSRVASLEEDFGVRTQREPNFDFAWSAHRWASGTSLHSVLRESDITVGDFVRTIRQIIDLLGQLMDAHPALAPLARETMKRIDRGVVAYSAVVA